MTRRRVTVVNDNPDFLELVGEILIDEQYAVTLIAGDRLDVLERVRASEPEVLLIDLRMGTEELHGWDLLQQIRRDAQLERLPTLICSADVVALQEAEQTIARMPRTAALAKPFAVDDLTTAVDRLLGAGDHGAEIRVSP